MQTKVLMAISTIIAISLAMSAALAAPQRDNSHFLQLQSGAWEWSHSVTDTRNETILHGAFCLPVHENGLTLEDFIHEMRRDCRAEDVTTKEAGFSFILSCADQSTPAEIVSSATNIQLKTGSQTALFGEQSELLVSSDARRVGSCAEF